MSNIKLTRISPMSAGKIMCFIYFVIGCLFAMFLFIAAPLNTSGKPIPSLAAVLLIIGYPIGGFIGGLIGAALFNLASNCLGGMEIQLTVEERNEP